MLITVGEAARRIGCSRSTVHRMIRSGSLGTIHRHPDRPRTRIKLEVAAVEDFLDRTCTNIERGDRFAVTHA